jgi:hypothetical protein
MESSGDNCHLCSESIDMTAIIVGLIVFNLINIPVYVFLFRQIFTNKEEFKEALFYDLRPDLISLFKGEWRKDFNAEIKLGLLFLCCAVLLTGEIQLMLKFLAFQTE